MTAQCMEQVIYKGDQFGMAAEPLNDYLCSQKGISFDPSNTACWRGYYGKWEITDKKLYLIALEAKIDGNKIDLHYFFPNQEKVFAEWFTGQIRIPMGEKVEHIHMGYASVYEKDLLLNFKKGVLVSEKIIDNCCGSQSKRIKFETMLMRIQENEGYFKAILQKDNE